ncbi:hypothetical protein CC78DRAFT_620456 [Lojkania enalia]|uniref:B-block binding subunit of TFIIIC domain-containing protein n=1 Tax=Lojkania enalia TaxID=147567 RepID=A0A9P4MWG3_9PLEO|nr:hypothetical protein CC78DRAFT_620456 [Didymosphaeria enalia]
MRRRRPDGGVAKGVDELIEFLLSEIALCGAQGAGSEDFRRFIQKFYQDSDGKSLPFDNVRSSDHAPGGLGRAFYERIWDWVRNERDIRIAYRDEIRDLTLTEFEAFELQETGTNGADYVYEQRSGPGRKPKEPLQGKTRPSNRSTFRKVLQQRFRAEGYDSGKPSLSRSTEIFRSNAQENGVDRESLLRNRVSALPEEELSDHNVEKDTEPQKYSPCRVQGGERDSRKVPNNVTMKPPIFDDPSPITTAPRIYASQNRSWYAVAGHGMDLNQLPLMEYTLLTIIASHGEKGIEQPELVRISQQDKRSVPHRTDELARKGYIVKRPIQAKSARTSLCIHQKYVKKTPPKVDDVFKGSRTIVLSDFVYLLYEFLKPIGIVAVRDLRNRMGIPVPKWNGRAVRTSLLRLEETGFIKRLRARKTGSSCDWIVCIRLERAPNEIDIKNLNNRRRNHSALHSEPTEPILEEDDEGDSLYRDVDLDMLEEANAEDEEDNLQEITRFPPQWTPDLLISNIIFEYLDLVGVDGSDGASLRDRTMGKFWRRPAEAFLSRVTDFWEQSQPPHLRHLAIIRDTAVKREKKFVHYIYRTYDNFQRVVNVGQALWTSVSKEVKTKSSGRSKQHPRNRPILDQWGFHPISKSNFNRRIHSSSLTESRATLVLPRTVRHRDFNIHESSPQPRAAGRRSMPRVNNSVSKDPLPRDATSNMKMRKEGNRAATELKRIQKYAQKLAMGEFGQISPTSVLRTPGNEDGFSSLPKDISKSIKKKQRQTPTKKAPSFPLLTAEQREELGLAPTGRLGKTIEAKIKAYRKETGDPQGLPDNLFENQGDRKRHNIERRTKVTNQNSEDKDEDQMEDIVQHDRPDEAHSDEAAIQNSPSNAKELEAHQEYSTEENSLTLPPGSRNEATTLRRERASRSEWTTIMSTSAVNTTERAVHGQAQTEMDSTSYGPLSSEETSPPTDATSAPNIAGPTVSDLSNQNDLQAERGPVNQEPGFTQAYSFINSLKDKGALQSAEQTPVKRTAGEQSEETQSSQRHRCTEGYIPSSLAVHVGSLASNKSKRASVERIAGKANQDIQPPKQQIHTKHHVPATPAAANESVSENSAPAPETIIASIETPHHGLEDPISRNKSSTAAYRTQSQPRTPASNLQDRINEIIRQFTDRPHPGVYINPFATRPIPRGRPMKALMAIFKSERLKDFPWFLPDDFTPVEKKFRKSKKDTQQAKLKTNLQPKPLTARSRPITKAQRSRRSDQDAPTELHSSVLPRAGSTGDQHDSSNEKHEDRQSPAGEKRRCAALSREVVKDSQYRPNAASSMETNECDILPILDTATVRENRVVEQVIPQPSAPAEASSGPAWNAVNGLAQQHQKQLYQSPYLRQSFTRPSMEGEGSAEDRVPSHTLDNAQELSTISNVHSVRTPNRAAQAWNKRGVVLGGGTVWHFRVQIIVDILTLCNGVFPFNGEISQPFYTLWEQRVGENMPKPDRTTLTNTINSMVENNPPRLKKMMFHIPGFDRNVPVQKLIVTFINLTSSSPQVKELQRNIIASHPNKFYPIQIRHLVGPEPAPRRLQLPEIDASIDLGQIYPRAAFELDQKISASARQRKRIANNSKKKSAANRKRKATEVEDSQGPQTQTRAGRTKRLRLDTLNKTHIPGTSRFRDLRRNDERKKSNGIPGNQSDSSDDTPLANLRPRSVTARFDSLDNESGGFETFDAQNSKSLSHRRRLDGLLSALSNPSVRFYPTIGTFSTEFAIENTSHSLTKEISSQEIEVKTLKRIRIAEDEQHDAGEVPRKKLRIIRYLSKAKNSTLVDNAEDLLSSDEEVLSQRILNNRATIRRHPLPSLLERLAGLTGHQSQPLYIPPRKKQKNRRPWDSTRSARDFRERHERKLVKIPYPIDSFKKLLFALVIVSSMSAEEEQLDWKILESIYRSDIRFDLQKTKKIWLWIKDNMASQVDALTSSFQSCYLDAYEKGEVASLEDPETYDWEALVEWALKTCNFAGPSLADIQPHLPNFTVDVSNYELFDRAEWYQKSSSQKSRAETFFKFSFGCPIHNDVPSSKQDQDSALRARALVRSNIATPQSVYDADLAHQKMSTLGETLFAKQVTEMVEQKIIRLRKLKRLLPGRNYNFTAQFATQFRRPFDIEEFMEAAAYKKILDAAFSKTDPADRLVLVSRTARDGAVMALLSLLNLGMVKTAAKLPPIDNNVSSPRPKISVWGFAEGDYRHRFIDRKQLFWDIAVVPTSKYQFGNPLQPSAVPSTPLENITWVPLPNPPLPGKDNPDALLPIWSSIDGKSVTWPWWARVLNVVIQAMIFQPGVSAAEIYKHCTNGVAELFEVELVLSWLLSINAIKQIGSAAVNKGTFIVQGGFWAVFGDELKEGDDDWFADHVKRARKNQPWRPQHNTQFTETVREESGEILANDETVREAIFQNPGRQYRVFKKNGVEKMRDPPATTTAAEGAASQATAARTVEERQIAPTAESVEDNEDVDAEGEPDDMIDAEGEPDDMLDAEGESDDEIL